MRIAIDAMGGDHAPAKILQGALDALPALEPDDQIILVGNETIIRQHIGPQIDAAGTRVRIEHASQVITMDDAPVEAIRAKRDSSIVRMVKLAKEGAADALISAGNTGALVAAGVLMLKPLAGADRPGLAVFLPSAKGAVMLCDAGANTQAKPAHLYQYAVMASLYVKAVRGTDHPTVGILNVGTEDEKGTPLVKDARDLIRADPALAFVGYVEGRDLPRHPCDVIITDGFTGNVVLKIIEGWSEMIFHTLQKEVTAEGPDTAAQLKPIFARLMKRYDHEEYGGALLLGLQGVFFKVHGSAGARAIKNAVVAAKSAGKLALNQQIESRLMSPAPQPASPPSPSPPRPAQSTKS
jgi:glycerol-3-phosphate acyltransferase PlsX